MYNYIYGKGININTRIKIANTTVCRTSPQILGQPLEDVEKPILDVREPVTLYIKGDAINRKRSADQREIIHFCLSVKSFLDIYYIDL